MSHSTMSFRMTLSDLERLSKIFNDTKRRAVSATAELLVCLTDVKLSKSSSRS